LQERKVSELNGFERQSVQQELSSWQERWIRYLVRRKQYAEAATAISGLPQDTRAALASSLVPLELQAAANLGTLDAKLAGYKAEPQSAPAAEFLRAAARQLFESGDKQSARKILELVFAREIEDHKLVAANFLGLAEIRLAAGDTAGALDLLRRLVVAVGNPFENLDPAAALLEKTGHNVEAIEFLDQLVKSAPWEPSYRLRLAKAKLAMVSDGTAAQDSLAAIGSAPTTSYDVRLKAAAALAGRPHSGLGSGELDLLASSPSGITATAADKFYFYEARVKAAESIADPQVKFQLLSHCLIDFPRRDSARVPLFEATANGQSPGYAIGILEPLFQSQFFLNYASQTGSEEERIASSGDEEEDSGDAPGAQSVTETQLSVAQRARISQMIGDTMARLGRIADALSYYESARRLETSAAVRKTLSHKIADSKATLRIAPENAARQPLLHEALEQDRVVRPRLQARVTQPSGPPAKGGVTQ